MTTKQDVTTEAPKVSERYFEAKGGRKTSVARARLYAKGKGMKINGKDYTEYFKEPGNQKKVMSPSELIALEKDMMISVHVSGGGIQSQAEAVRNAIAKAFVVFDSEYKKRLKKAGFITRDPRAVERKKYGLKKARRAPQWAKR